MENIINPHIQALPESGRVGYVHIVEKNYDETELKPRLFDADSYEFTPVI